MDFKYKVTTSLKATFWGVAVEGIFMTNKIVKYHNDVHTVSLRGFTASELDIFVAILSCMRDKGEDVIAFTFDEIKRLVRWKPKDNERFLLLLKSTYDKLLTCNIKIGDSKNWTSFVLFTKYTVSSDDSEVTIAVNKELKYTLNALLSNFTRFELDEFISLKSTYTKEFYRRMKQFKSSGFWRVSLGEFRRVMNVPEKYKMTMIDLKVLAPIMSELGEKYKLKIIKEYDNTKRGRPSVCGFKFTFLKESELNCNSKAKAIDIEEANLELIDLSGNSGEQESPKTFIIEPQKQGRKPDMELNESLYVMRTIKVRDKKFTEQFNYLKIMNINYNFKSGTVFVEVKNMDDEYVNTMSFPSVTVWNGYFNKHVV